MERERGSFRPKINMNASILQTENWPDCRINTAQKVPVCGFILVRIFPAFSRIWTEYGEIRSISPYSVRMRENAGKMRTRITPNTDTFYAV